MRIRDVSWRRYQVPFVVPFRTAHGETRQRDGLIIRLMTAGGLHGLGEAAPLTTFGGGDAGQAETMLSRVAPDLIGREAQEIEPLLDSWLPNRPDTSALRCALDMALLDLEATGQGVRLVDLLVPNAARAVTVNATIGESEADAAVQAARVAVADGYETIKLKIGMAGSIADEVRRVAAVRAAIGPSVALRLDANGAWKPDPAIEMLTALAEFDVELVEQPVAASDLNGLALVRRSVAIPIAVDEAVTDLESARRVIEAGAADTLIVKPMVCGGLRVARRMIRLASDSGLRVIVTSSVESGVGVAAVLHLAATLPEGSPACGLATAGLLADDLILESLEVIDGEMRLPDGSGLGVALDEEGLDAFAVADWRCVA